MGQCSPYKQSIFLYKKRHSGEDNKHISDLSNKSSSEKYKTLVESNNRKNYQIWIKSDSVVRIPKAIRQSQEQVNQIQDQRSINQISDNNESPSDKDKYQNSQKDFKIKLGVRESAIAQNKYGFPRDKTHIAQQIQKTQFDTCDFNTSRHLNIVSLISQKEVQRDIIKEQTLSQKQEISKDKLFILNHQNSLKSFNQQIIQEDFQNQQIDFSESLMQMQQENQINGKVQQQSVLKETNSEILQMKDIGGTQIFIESAKFSDNKFTTNFQDQREFRFGNKSSEINQKYSGIDQKLKKSKQNQKHNLIEMKEEVNASDLSQLTDKTVLINLKGSHKNLNALKNYKTINNDTQLDLKIQQRKNYAIGNKNLSINLNNRNSSKLYELKENTNILNLIEERKKNKTQLNPVKSQLVKIQKQIMTNEDKSSSATISVHLNYNDIDLNNDSNIQPEIKRPSSGQQQYDSDLDKEINIGNKKSGFEIVSHINATTSQDTIINQKPQECFQLQNNNLTQNICQIQEQQITLFIINQIEQKQNTALKKSINHIQVSQNICTDVFPLPKAKQSNKTIKQKDHNKQKHLASDVNLIEQQKQLSNLLKYEQNSLNGTEKTAGHFSSKNSLFKQNIDTIKLENTNHDEPEIQNNSIPKNNKNKPSQIIQIQKQESQKHQLCAEVKKAKIILEPITAIQKNKSVSKYVQTQDYTDQVIQKKQIQKIDQAIQKNLLSDKTQSKIIDQKSQKHKSQNSLFGGSNKSNNKINSQRQDSLLLQNNFNPIAQTIQSEEPVKNNDLLSNPISKSISNHPYFKSEGDKIEKADFQNTAYDFNPHQSENNKDQQSLNDNDGLPKFVQIIDKDCTINFDKQKQEIKMFDYQDTIDINQQLNLIQNEGLVVQSKEIISTSQSAIFGKQSECQQIQQLQREMYMEQDMTKTISSKDEDKNKKVKQDIIKVQEQSSLTTRIKIQNMICNDKNSICEQSAYKSQQTVNQILPHNQDSIFRNNFNQDSIQQSSAMVSSTINLVQEHNVNFQNCINQYNDDAIMNGDSYFLWQNNQEIKTQSFDKGQNKFNIIKQKKQLESTKIPIINIQANVFDKPKKNIQVTQNETKQDLQNSQQLAKPSQRNMNVSNVLNSQKSDQKCNDQLSQLNILTAGSPQNESKISDITRFKQKNVEKSILASSYNVNQIPINSSNQRNKFIENLNNSQYSNRSSNQKNNDNYFPVNSSNDHSSFIKNRDLQKFQLQSLNQYYNSNKNKLKTNVFSESGGDQFRNNQKNRYSRKILSVEPLSNQFGLNSNDFLKERMILRQNEGEFITKNTEQIRLEPQFNLKQFIRKNNLQKILINDFNQNNSIYNFHKNNIFQGVYKNQGPAENQLDISSNKYQSHNYHVHNFRNQVKQLAQNKHYPEIVNQSQIKNQENSNSSKKRQNNPNNEFDEVLGNGLINIEQAFMLIQYIRRSQGIPVMSELEIVDYIVNQKSLNLEINYSKNADIQSLIKKYKWREVMKFMKANPHVLMQLLSLNEFGNKNNQPQLEDEFNIPIIQAIKNQKEIQARQRYTDIVLNNMKSRAPPAFIQQQRHNIQQINNNVTTSKNLKPFQRRNLKIISRHNQHEIESNLQGQKNKKQLNDIKFRLKDSKNINNSIDKNQNSSRKLAQKTTSDQRVQNNQKQTSAIQDFNLSKKNVKNLPSLPIEQQQNREQLAQKTSMRIKSLEVQQDQNAANDFSILNKIFNQNLEKEQRNIQHQKLNSQINLVFKTHQQQELNENQIERFRNINYEKYYNPQSQMNVGSFQKMQNQNGALKENFIHKIDMKQYMSSIDMKKPKTNQIKKRQKKIVNNVEQLQDMNSFSIKMQMKEENIEPENNIESMEQSGRNLNNKSQPDIKKKNSEELYKKLQSNPYSKQFIIHENLTVEDQMQIEVNKNLSMFDSKTNKNIFQDRKSDFSNNRTSFILSRNEDLNKQKQMLENEEQELTQQRNHIQREKDKITKMLLRLEKKQELSEKEEYVKKQRMILEIEKKKLRDDIQELDDLKTMLEQKKKDNLVGFSDLAESNKEMRSLKSGDLHKDRQFMLSKQSLRSRKFEFNKDIKKHSGSLANNRLMSEENKSQIYTNIENPTDQFPKLSVTSNNYKPQQEIMSVNDHSPINKINIKNQINQQKEESEYGSNYQKRCKTVENETNEVNDYHDVQNNNNNIFQKQVNEYDSVVIKSMEHKPIVKKNFTQVDENSNNNMQGSVNSKWLGPQNMLNSPFSQSNMTFITGHGVFDWAHSLLMEDILKKQVKFNRSYKTIDKDSEYEDIAIFTEEEIYQQIDQIKISHKNLRNPEVLEIVFDKAYYTLETLMGYMNQSVLFEIISEKYQDITIDNCVKLLVRCKQVLESRQLAYNTLKEMVQFEMDVQKMRVEIDSLLENSQNKELLRKLQEKSVQQIPNRAIAVVDGITKLRDQYKLFNKIAATTSKGNQVLNIMAYKKRDALRYIQREYESIRRLVQVVDIQMPNLKLK